MSLKFFNNGRGGELAIRRPHFLASQFDSRTEQIDAERATREVFGGGNDLAAAPDPALPSAAQVDAMRAEAAQRESVVDFLNAETRRHLDAMFGRRASAASARHNLSNAIAPPVDGGRGLPPDIQQMLDRQTQQILDQIYPRK